MPYFLAVDSGGTKAEFLLADETRELKRVFSGAIRPVNADTAVIAANVAQALAALEEATGVRMEQVTRTCIGTSGETVPLVVDSLRGEFSKRVGGELLILGDVEIAFDAAFQGGRGVLVLAGTGSNLAARASNGAITTAGGWGPNLADQGSGHFIGLEGLRRGFLARDEQRPTQLLEAAQELWDLPSLGALIEFANKQHPVRYASTFAPKVVSLAEEGDEVAIEILDHGGRDLAYLASLLIERIRKAEGDSFTLPSVATAGSILTHVTRLRESMRAALRERYPSIEFVETPADPVRGALWHAMQGR